MYYPKGNKGYHEIKIDWAELKRSEIYNHEICDNLNITILKSNLGRIKGFLQYYKKQHHYLIQVNQKCQKFTKIIIAHELGHYFLYKNLITFKMENCSLVLGEKLEHQANIFATELLLPDHVLYQESPRIQGWTSHENSFILPTPCIFN